VVLELVHAPDDARIERAEELKGKIEAYWPQLTVRARASAPPKGGARCGSAHAFDLLWVETRGASRRSCVLHAQPGGAPLPSVRALLTAVRKKIEGDGVLDNLGPAT
jgi:hypothetical protein